MRNLLLLFAFSYLFSGTLYAERMVRVKDKIRISKSQVTMQDLLLDSSLLSDKEKEIVILSSPERGSRRLSMIDLAYAMQIHKSLHDLALSGSNHLEIQRIANPALLELVRLNSLNFLIEKKGFVEGEFEITLQGKDAAKIQKYPNITAVKVTQARIHSQGRSITINLELFQEDEKLQDLMIQPLFRRRIEILSCRQALPRGHILSKEDLQLKKVWSDEVAVHSLHQENQAIGYELLAPTKQNQALLQTLLAAPVCARRGDIVETFISQGPLQLRITAKALKTGRRGDIVQVINTKSGKQLDVRLTAPLKAEVL